LSAKLTAFFAACFRWMDGSLFFRGLAAMLDFIKNICADSYIARAFVADSQPLEDSTQRSLFAIFANKILNGLPKPITSPALLNRSVQRLFSASTLMGKLFDGVGITIPQEPEQGKNVNTFSRWALFAFPAVGILAVLFATPFLPTMMLAFVLIPIILLILLSRPFVIDSTTIFLLIFIIISFLISFISFTPRSSISIVLLTSVFMLSAPAIVAIVTSKKTVDFFMLTFVFSASLTGLYGVYQVFAGYENAGAWIDTTLFANQPLRVFSSFGNPNVYATYLLLAIPIAAACIIFFKNIFIKFCAVCATALLLINLLLTLSRGSYVALAIAVFVFILIMEKRLIILLMGFMLTLPFILPPSILARILSIVNFSDTSTSIRISIWRGSLRIISDFWLSGVGQGLDAYHTVYPYYSLAAANTLHSHNLYLQMLVGIGIGGFFVFICILACFIRAMVNFLRRTNEFRLKVMCAAIIVGMIGFLVQSAFDYTFFNYRILLMFYLYIGLGLAFTRVYKGDEKLNSTMENKFIIGYHND